MSRDIVWTTRFKKDYKLAMKRHLDINLLLVQRMKDGCHPAPPAAVFMLLPGSFVILHCRHFLRFLLPKLHLLFLRTHSHPYFRHP